MKQEINPSDAALIDSLQNPAQITFLEAKKRELEVYKSLEGLSAHAASEILNNVLLLLNLHSYVSAPTPESPKLPDQSL